MPLPPARSQSPETEAGATPAPESEPMGETPSAGGRDPAAPSAVQDDEPYRVLIVEDDRSQALFAESVLGGSGIQTRSAAEAAEVLPAHDADRLLCHRLVGPEIQFEAVAQHLVVDIADAALPRRAGVRHEDIDAAEGGGDLVEGGADL